MTTLVVRGPSAVEGRTTVPGDKSISHRALMIAAMAQGRSHIHGLGPGDDVDATRRCLESYGIGFDDAGDGVVVHGTDIASWREPLRALDCANSGTTMRLLSGLAARCPFSSSLDGDASLRRRPMDRIVHPLRNLGARVDAVDGVFPPLTVGGGSLTGTRIAIDVPSAQVKSCVILAALGASGRTTISMPVATRDHTEQMLCSLGAEVESRRRADGSVEIAVNPPFTPSPFSYEIPGDVSSAAFLVAAGLLCGHVEIVDVGLNATRVGFLDVCRRMGASLVWVVNDTSMGESNGRIDAERSTLRGVGVEGRVVPLMIDEVPLLAVLGTAAEGTTTVTGADELRVKESDRISAIVAALRRMGAEIDERPDGFEVRGPSELNGAVVSACGDHRIAMALAIAALRANGETRIEGFEAAAVSWPGFEEALSDLGADVELQ